MKVIVFQTENYRGCLIYYRQLGHYFEYLVVIRGRLYEAHVVITPRPAMRLARILKRTGSEYSKSELDKIISVLRRLAQGTIDKTLKKNGKT
jgi:hypothetical protein